MTKQEKLNKIEKLLSENLGCCEGYERGEVDLTWKEQDEYDYPDGLVKKMAEDILKAIQ